MKEFNDTPHPDFCKGFNQGYLIANHFPDLSKGLTKSLSDTEQSKGFEAGVRQFILEKLKTYEPAWMKNEFLPDEPDEPEKAKKDKEQDRE